MENKEMIMIIKIMGILGAIFCLLALVTPWSASSFTFGIFSETYSTPFYIDLFTNELLQNILGVGEVIFFAIVMIIIFILTLIALILSINNIRNVGKITPNKYFTLGILLIIDVILYIIAVSILSSGISTFGAYGIGFAMAIISAIMFFIIYFLQKTYMPAVIPKITHQPPYQQHAYTPAQPAYQQQIQQTSAPQPSAQPQQQQPIQKSTQATESPTPKFCSQCGSPVLPNTKFCSQCGNKL